MNTADTPTAHVDPSLLRAFFAELSDLAARLVADARAHPLTLGGDAVVVRTVGGDALVAPLLHRTDPRAGTVPNSLRIDVVVGAALPSAGWKWDETVYEADDDLSFSFDPQRRALVATSTAQGRAVVWFEHHALGAWELAAPLRPTLDRLLAPRGHTMVHAAAVGRDGRCVLIAGPGGSGKSTTVHAALMRGFESVGDDFVLLPAGGGTTVESLYATMRLAPTSPRFDPARHVVRDDGFGNEKALVMVEDEFPGALVERQRAVALVSPVLTVGSSRVDLQACKLEYSIVSPK